MRKYYNQSLATSEITPVLEGMDVSKFFSGFPVSVREESTLAGRLFHAGASRHAVDLGLVPSMQKLGDLAGRWCSCLTSALTDPYRGLPVGLTNADRLVLAMMAYEISLRGALASFRVKPSVPLRRALQEAATLSGYSSPLYLAQRELSWSLSPAPAQRLSHALEVSRTGLVAEIKRVLASPELNGAARPRALKKLVESSWLLHVERDETPVLMGALDAALQGAAGKAEALPEVLSTHTVHVDEVRQVTFYRLPAYVAGFLLRLGPTPALGVQVVPWADLDLADLADLWSPTGTDLLCDLSRAVDALGRV